MTRLRALLGFAIVAVCLGLAGCSGAASERETGKVTGTVTLDGQPFTGGRVNFRSEKSGNAATADIGSDGTFAIDEMIADTYTVVIAPLEPTPGEPGQPVANNAASVEIPPKYREAATSGFTAEVKAGNNHFDFAMMK